jgi:hypothetical protein
VSVGGAGLKLGGEPLGLKAKIDEAGTGNLRRVE